MGQLLRNPISSSIAATLGFFSGGSVLNFAPPAGVLNNVNPGGTWPSALIGRLEIDTSAGNTTWTGLVAEPQDGYGVLVTNVGPNVLTLAALNAGSAAANQFRNLGDLALAQNNSAFLVYYLGVTLWVVH